MSKLETYTSAHETLTADEIVGLFGGSHGNRLIQLRRLDNHRLRILGTPPNRENYDLSHQSDDWHEWLDDCNKAEAARSIHRARRGRDLGDILRNMSFEEKEAYLYRSNG